MSAELEPRDDRSGGEAADRSIKKIKTMKHEDVYVQNIPSCEAYEKSYMHRDVVTHVLVTKTQFLITASVDGVVKFWKKTSNGIQFVKTFKSHAGPIDDLSVTPSGSELASISRKDKSVKIFDIVNFDMINMLSLDFEPNCIEWIHFSNPGEEDLVIADSNLSKMYTFDSRQATNKPRKIIDHVHRAIVHRIRSNPKQNMILSVDQLGVVKYWRLKDGSCDVVKHPNAEPKTTSVLHEFLNTQQNDHEQASSSSEHQTKSNDVRLHNVNFTPDGDYFVTTSSDLIVRIFKFKSGKLVREYDNSMAYIEAMHKSNPIMNNMDFARRMAMEREIDRNNITRYENAVFDQSGNFVLFPTMLGVKIWNWKTNRLLKSLGKDETNFRPLSIGLFQGLIYEKVIRKFNSDSLESGVSDPTLYCTSYKKNRFYCFSNRYFEENVTTEGDSGEMIKDRDIFNEKPSREEITAAVSIEEAQKIIFENATIHTTMGDIHLKLYPKIAPKACENFSTLSRNNYYNNHIFHRVIKQFMIQTGDPTGTGTGGESMWDEDFEDEFSQELRHDKPFTLSMANCGPNTNGSQFFITVVPCPFLDNKHTAFGRVVKGMDVCQAISKVKTDPKTDKPYNDVKIININVF